MSRSVSIVVPAYNATEVLPICIDALFAQAQKPEVAEIIILDDASTDNTAEIAEARVADAKAHGYQMRVLRQPVNAGPAAARNRGGFEATGDVVIFTDSDCAPLPHWLGEMLKPFDDPSVSAVKGAYLSRQPEMGARFAQAEFEERYRMLEASESVDVVFSYSAAFLRSVFVELGGFDSRFPVADNEDTELSWRLVEAGHRIVFNPNAELFHRHPPSLRTYFKKKISRGYWRMIVYRRYPDKAVKDSYTPQGLKVQILLSFLMIVSLMLSLVFPALWTVTGVLAVIFVLTTLPFALAIIRKDPVLAVLSPLLLLGRALSLGFGVLSSLPRAFSKDPFAKVEKTT